MKPTVHYITQHGGIAGQLAVVADVEYPGEPRRLVSFTGSRYGGPVVMGAGATQVFVDDPGRFGEFGKEWVRRFYA